MNMDKLHLLAMALLEKEILDGEEIERIFKGEKLEDKKNNQKDKDDK